MNYKSILTAVGVILALLLVMFFATMRPIKTGEICIKTTWGEATGIGTPGLNFRVPLVQGYKCFSQRRTVFETSDQPKESKADYTDFEVSAQTSDGQQITVRYSVGFHVEPAEVGYVFNHVAENTAQVVERVVKFHSRSLVRLKMQAYTATTLYTGNIFQVQADITKDLRELFNAEHVFLEDFAIRKIGFTEEYADAVEQKQIAAERVKTREYEADQAVFEAQRNAALAKGEADAQIERARGDAEAQKIRAQGEADAIKLRGEALKKFPEILQLNFIEQLKNITWGFLPVDSVTPFLPIPIPSATPTPIP